VRTLPPNAPEEVDSASATGDRSTTESSIGVVPDINNKIPSDTPRIPKTKAAPPVTTNTAPEVLLAEELNQRVFDLTNQFRTTQGLTPYKICSPLEKNYRLLCLPAQARTSIPS